VQRSWCGRLGKVENCQVGVFLGSVSDAEHALVDFRLCQPKEWAKDRKLRKVADDHPQILRLVMTVLRDTAAGHGRSLLVAEGVTGNAVLQPRKPHPPTQRGILNPGFGGTSG
jgi:SRSO17 transposase